MPPPPLRVEGSAAARAIPGMDPLGGVLPVHYPPPSEFSRAIWDFDRALPRITRAFPGTAADIANKNRRKLQKWIIFFSRGPLRPLRGSSNRVVAKLGEYGYFFMGLTP